MIVNTYPAHTLYVRAGVFAFQIFLVDVLHHVPADMQVPGHVQYCVAHAQQVKHITGEAVSIAYLTVGKGDICLPCLLTVLAPIALYT